MASKISSAAKSVALSLVRGVRKEDRPVIFYADREVTREWRGYGGWKESVTWTFRSDEDSLDAQMLAYGNVPHVLIDAKTGTYELCCAETTEKGSTSNGIDEQEREATEGQVLPTLRSGVRIADARR
jgi:hypothetical protein